MAGVLLVVLRLVVAVGLVVKVTATWWTARVRLEPMTMAVVGLRWREWATGRSSVVSKDVVRSKIWLIEAVEGGGGGDYP